MHKKTKKKIFITIITILVLLYCLEQVALATGLDDPTAIISGPDSTGVGELNKLGNAILGVVQYVSIGVASIATLILAIRYMYSAPDEKADIKKKLIPFIIGGVLVFGAIQLVKLVEVFVGEII